MHSGVWWKALYRSTHPKRHTGLQPPQGSSPGRTVCVCVRTHAHARECGVHARMFVCAFFTSCCVVHYVLSAPFMLDPYRQRELGVEHKRPKDEPSRRLRPAKLERQRVLLAIPAAVPATGREHIGGSNGVPTRSCTPRHSERRSLSSTDTFGRWLGDYQMNLFSRVRRSANRRYGSRSQNICRESVSSCANGQLRKRTIQTYRCHERGPQTHGDLSCGRSTKESQRTMMARSMRVALGHAVERTCISSKRQMLSSLLREEGRSPSFIVTPASSCVGAHTT
jgi:hypothetical protein